MAYLDTRHLPIMKHNIFSFLKSHFPITSLLFFLAMSACEDEASCVSNSTNMVDIRFYKIDTVSRQMADTVRYLSVMTEDGQVLYMDTLVTSLRLPLNPGANKVSFLLAQDTAVTDTLHLLYEREQRLISPECGVDQRFFNLDVGRQTFDSIHVSNDELKKFNSPHIAIYNCQYGFDDTVKLRFYRINAEEGLVRDTVHLVSVTDDRGNVLANMEPKSSLLVPVNPDAGRIALFFQKLLADGQTVENDTLILSYRKQLVQIANCKPQIRYDQLDTVSYSFDSLSFDNKTLDRNNAGNIRIFY